MIRPDIEMFSRMVKKQIIPQQLANTLIAKPLFIVPSPNQRHPTWMTYVDPAKSYPCSQLSKAVTAPFDDFVALLDDLYFHIVLRDNEVFDVSYCVSTEEVKRFVHLRCISATDSPTGKCIFRIDRYYEKGNVVVFVDESSNWRKSPTRVKTELSAKGILNEFDKLISSALATILLFIEFQDSLGLYPVKVEREKKPRKGLGVREQLERHQGAHLIYLDRLPSQPNAASHNGSFKPTGNHVRPHERRGHTKTLKHPRYKDHPLYMVENAIRVKPSWVGDKSAIVNGNVYTVLG